MGYKNGVKNRKPRNLVATKLRGNVKGIGNSNYTSLDLQKAIYEKGMELYRQGKVRIDSNGYFKVSGYQVDTEKVNCRCPDYQKYKKPCKHLYSVFAFQKHGKPDSHTTMTIGDNSHDTRENVNKQRTITRLAVLNTATAILSTHPEPVKLKHVLSLAAHLEHWALGGEL